MVIVFIILVVLFGIPVIHGIIDGWNGTTKYRSLYGLEDTNTIEDIEDVTITDEIAHLESMIDRLNEQYIIYERELESTYNEKKRAILLSKLNTIDDRTFRLKNKIRKLQEKLE